MPNYNQGWGNVGWQPYFPQTTTTPYMMRGKQSNIISVSGPESAKSMASQLGPDSHMMYMDMNQPKMYLVETDGNGYPSPLRTFDISEETVQTTPRNATVEYVTVDDFDKFKTEILEAVTGGADAKSGSQQSARRKQ